MMRWLRSESFQKSGAEIRSSDLERSSFLLAASKIAPHSDGLLAERFVLPGEFVERHDLLYRGVEMV
jgi:hypothetical protein